MGKLYDASCLCKSVFNVSSEREDTIIIGDSMGGYGALKCAFSSPCLFLKEDLDEHGEIEKFRMVYGEQLLKDFQEILGGNLEWSDQHEILNLANKIKDQSVRPKIYMACGTEDFLRDTNERFNNEMQKLNFDIEYEEWSGNHDWYFFNEALRKALKKVLK
ncbi:alpha/beta hydrolase-fold protein [Brevibacillus formosus]